MFSGGAGSFMAAKRVVEEYGCENTILLFTDTKTEDEDLYRFITETTTYLNSKLISLSDGRDVWEVYKDVKFLGNSRIAPCTRILKQTLAREWIEKNYDPKDVTLYIGIDWSEAHRLEKIKENWKPYKIYAPLMDKPYLSKEDIFGVLKRFGIGKPRLYDMGFSHNNCFKGSERFITDKGIKSFKEMEGQKLRVLGKNKSWKDAEIKSFGEQELVKLTIKRYKDTKEIYTTKDHRWFVRSGRTKKIEKLTRELEEGQPLFSMYSILEKNVKPSPFGIAQGIVFGDGSKSYTTNAPVSLTLCGEKDKQLLKWFPNCNIKEVKNIGMKVSDLPRTWKDVPTTEESKSFLYGWLSGYFAADGTVKSNGDIKIHSAKLEHIEFVKDVCIRLGIGVNKIRVENRKGFNEFETPLYSLSFIGETLREDFFVIKEHKERFLQAKKKRPAEWKVISVENTKLIEKVYCAVVEDGNAFTLEDNIFTGNCGGFCCKAGQGHFANLLQQMPERYAYHEKKEEEMRKYLGKNVAILKKQRDNNSFPYTLKQLREDIESKDKQIDLFDMGGCGCFIEESRCEYSVN